MAPSQSTVVTVKNDACILDLGKSHKVRRHGDLLAIYTWVNDERALVLLPALRENAAHAQDVGYLRLIAAPLAAWTGCCHRLAFSTLKDPTLLEIGRIVYTCPRQVGGHVYTMHKRGPYQYLDLTRCP
jgi:hypothetical protein